MHRTGLLEFREERIHGIRVRRVARDGRCADLVDEGRVLDVGTAEQAGPGKRATLVDLDRSRLLTLAVDLSVPAGIDSLVRAIRRDVNHKVRAG